MAASRSLDRSLLAARLAAQRLSGTTAVDVVDATRHLLAVQGQDPRAARLALRARMACGHASAVDRALTDERSLIITSVNRGTLHLIAAEDGPGRVILRVRERAGSGLAGELMDCFYCASVWAALPFARRHARPVLAWLALSGGACLLEQATRAGVQ